MHVIYVENDAKAIEKFEKISAEIPEIEKVCSFQQDSAALEYIREQQVDIVFLGMEPPEMNGISLARQLQEIKEDLHFVFISDRSVYALQAFEVAADGYLLNSYSREELENQIRNIQRKFHMEERPHVYFQTIPRFELFIDGHLIPISKKRVKELLALLVDFAGSSLTSEQAINYLWEDRPLDDGTKALMRMTAKRLREFLVQEKIDYILIEENGVRAIDTQCVDCDYYQILRGNKDVMKKYYGEYMVEYSWAETTNARLLEITGKLQEIIAL